MDDSPKLKRAGRRTGVRQALEASEARYKNLVEQLPLGIYRTTPDGQIIEANPALARILGVKKPRELFKVNVKDLYINKAARIEHLERLASTQTAFTEFELRGLGGRRFWARDFSRAVKGPEGTILYFDGILVDITEQKRAEKKLERALHKIRETNEKLASLTWIDDLTGLHNRRGFFTLALQQLKIAKRIKKDVFLVFLDIDNLKLTNDSFGHSAGDGLLSATAEILKSTLRESDVIARIGGDEFAVLAMRGKSSSEKAIMKRIEDGVRAFNLESEGKSKLSLSMGVVRFDRRKFSSLDEYLAHADFLMYQQKRTKNRFRAC